LKGLELKILFKNSEAYLTNDKPIKISQLNLNDYIKNFKSYAYWTLRVKNYIEVENKMFCEIISYQNGESEFNQTQIQLADKLNSLQNLSFNKISTPGLLSTLGKTSRRSIPRTKYKTVDKPKRIQQTKPIEKESFKQHIHETFYVPIKEVNFKLGYVSFEKKFSQYQKIIKLEIPNNDIKEEYDAIKNYFANVLKTKKIQVTVNIDIVDYKITKQNVNSPEIDRIDKQLIEEVKFDYIKSTTKRKINPEKENNLFTVEEYFESLENDEFESKTFFNNDEEFLEDLLKITNTKHYKHLRLLSSKHSHGIMKLRFTLKPFAFIFLITGVKNYHFVWETLNTEEATYVWHISKDLEVLKVHLKKIEEIIKAIKIDGKFEYINNTDDNFNRIFHDYSESINGFKKWKNELERILI